MRIKFLLALLCLIVGVESRSQDHFQKMGNDSLYILDSVLIKALNGIPNPKPRRS